MCRIILLSIIFFSSFSYAKHPLNIFVKREFNATDTITGFGASVSISPSYHLVKGEFITSLNYAEILDKTGDMQHFLSLDTGVRLGIYGKAYIYVEAGFDTLEIFFDDARDNDHFNDYQEDNDIDGYAGLGVGFKANNTRIEGFVKARQIDGDNWDSDKQIFYGLQVSLFF
jgi:hypothetical protein